MIALAAIVFGGSLVLVVLSLCWLVMSQEDQEPPPGYPINFEIPKPKPLTEEEQKWAYEQMRGMQNAYGSSLGNSSGLGSLTLTEEQVDAAFDRVNEMLLRDNNIKPEKH